MSNAYVIHGKALEPIKASICELWAWGMVSALQGLMVIWKGTELEIDSPNTLNIGKYQV